MNTNHLILLAEAALDAPLGGKTSLGVNAVQKEEVARLRQLGADIQSMGARQLIDLLHEGELLPYSGKDTVKLLHKNDRWFTSAKQAGSARLPSGLAVEWSRLTPWADIAENADLYDLASYVFWRVTQQGEVIAAGHLESDDESDDFLWSRHAFVLPTWQRKGVFSEAMRVLQQNLGEIAPDTQQTGAARGAWKKATPTRKPSCTGRPSCAATQSSPNCGGKDA